MNAKKMLTVGAVVGILAAGSAPAWATGPLVDNSTNANAAAAAAASATGGNVGNISNSGGTHIQTTTVTPIQNNTQITTQGQTQGQAQHQGQLQGQAQGQSADNKGNHQNVSFESPVQDRMPGLAVAPGLTAAGTGVCLGSVSIGLSGPMAGASFGITKVDKGCEQRSAAALLYQMGYKDAAVRLLMKNDDVREALGTDAPASRKAELVPAEKVQPMSTYKDNRAPFQAASVLQVQMEQMQGM